MKKRTGTILTVLLCLLMILVIPACDNKTPEPEETVKPETPVKPQRPQRPTAPDIKPWWETPSPKREGSLAPHTDPLDKNAPYSTKYYGVFDDQVTQIGDPANYMHTAKARYSLYIPKDTQTRSPLLMVLVPDGKTASEYVSSEAGQLLIGLADGSGNADRYNYDKFAVAFIEGWNLKWNTDKRDDALAVYGVFKQINSTSPGDNAFYSLDKNRVYLMGIEEGAEAALYAAAEYPSTYANLSLIELPKFDEKKLVSLLSEKAYPYLTSNTNGFGEVFNFQVQMPVFAVSTAGTPERTASDRVVEIYDTYATLHIQEDSTEKPELIVHKSFDGEDMASFLQTVMSNGRYLGYPGGTIRDVIPVYAEGFKLYDDDAWTFKEPKMENREPVLDAEGKPVMVERNHFNRFVTYAPAGLSEGKHPLVLVLHGNSAAISDLISESRWSEIADEEGLIICFVQGTMAMDGKAPTPGWPGANVVKQLEHDIAKMKELFPGQIDETRIYAAGHSAGAMTLGGTVMKKAPTLAAAYSMNGGFMGGSDEAGKFLTPCIGQMAQYDFAPGSKAPEAKDSMDSIVPFLTLNGMPEDTKGVAHRETLGNNKYFTTDFNIGTAPVVRYTGVAESPHVFMAEEARMSWEFFKDWSRSADGTSSYKGTAVAMPEAPAAE